VNDPVECLVEAEIAAELPGLRLWSLDLDAPEAPSPDSVRFRLGEMSSRFLGGQAIALRSKPIPHAYRVFYRHIGLDPDVDRVPVESVVVERLKAGQFRSESLYYDAQTIAVMETSVPVWCLDADTLIGDLEIRRVLTDEVLGRGARYETWLPPGRLVVADLEGAVAVLFGEVAQTHAVVPATKRARLFTVQVEGVPAIHVSEALWTVADIVTGSDPDLTR
jgi:DNA/RNA-binding domain of Phe-tRNA-synthetase-like protein